MDVLPMRLMQDLRYGGRVLFRNAGFTAVAVLSLALGIGANTSVFSVVNAVLLRPLPFPQPERLVKLEMEKSAYWSYPKFRAVRERVRTLDNMAGFAAHEMTLRGAAMPERVHAELVSATYFPLLGTTPLLGRAFSREDEPAALLGHALWRNRFGGDRDVLGRRIVLGNTALTVTGILPPGFRGLSGTTEIWAPMGMAPALFNIPRRLEQPNAHWLQAAARLKHGVPVQAARADIAAAAKSSGWGARLDALADSNVDPLLRNLLLVLLGAVGFVLLIACANIAGLMLARGASREQEMAVRLAIGAGRFRVVRQLLTESALLGLLGGLAGLVLALWAVDAMSAFKPGNAFTLGSHSFQVPGFNPIRIDLRVLGFNFAIALLSAILFGLLPAWRASRPGLMAALKEGVPGAGLGRLRLRGLLVSCEVALALVLLTGAGLMLNSLARLLSTPVGFDAQGVLSCRLDQPEGRSLAEGLAFWEALSARAASLPGVQSAAYGSAAPLAGIMEGSLIAAVGSSERHPVGIHSVGSDFFRTLRVPVRRGRGFTEQDRTGMPPVIILNEAAARKLFPGEDAIGRRVSLAAWNEALPSLEVVGVVGNVRYGAVEEPFEPQVYLSAYQNPMPYGFLFLRAGSDPAGLVAALRRETSALDRNVPVYDAKSMEQRLAEVTARPRFTATLLGVFAAVALALAAVGVYGVTAYAVSRRVREFGIRIALGAGRRDVLRMVFAQGLLLTGAGLAAGVGGALALTRYLETQLYQVRPNDPATFAATAAVLGAIALGAICVPAARAMRVDPIRALRYE